MDRVDAVVEIIVDEFTASVALLISDVVTMAVVAVVVVSKEFQIIACTMKWLFSIHNYNFIFFTYVGRPSFSILFLL